MRLLQPLPEAAQIRSATMLGMNGGGRDDFTNPEEWARRFTSPAVRSEAIGSAMAAVYDRDASRVDPLLAKISDGANRDAALHGIATAMTEKAPAAAATRALGIADGAIRHDTLDAIILEWRKRDPEAVTTWLQGATEIPAAWKEPWLKTPRESAPNPPQQ